MSIEKELKKGAAAEIREHGSPAGKKLDVIDHDVKAARKIAASHLTEDPKYYSKLEKFEKKEIKEPTKEKKRKILQKLIEKKK